MNLLDIWNEKTKAMFTYVDLGKQALENLGYVEDNKFDDRGGNNIVLMGEEKKFNTISAFFVGAYLKTTEATELSEFDMKQVLRIFNRFFWASGNSSDIKKDIDENTFWDEESFEVEEYAELAKEELLKSRPGDAVGLRFTEEAGYVLELRIQTENKSYPKEFQGFPVRAEILSGTKFQ